MELQLYNTLTRKKESFTPLKAEHVRMYVCGPTVYDKPHIGNARSVVVYDVLFRLLNHLAVQGLWDNGKGETKITYARNITDVDDKINAAAKERGITIGQLTKEVTAGFHADMDALNVLPPTLEPKATEHIGHIIAMIEQLVNNNHAYVAAGHVLFSVASDPQYGILSRRTREDMIAGSRVEVAPYKKDPGDFVLWKPAGEKDDPSSVFDSPWSKGRPGWHIECSAMSTAHLGQDFDIHGGGADLMFPHHENEIAQSTCALPGSHFAKYWVHNGFLTVNGEKMSKSLGNFITVRDLLDKGVKGEVIRYALLSTHYSKPLDWNEKLLSDAQKVMDRLYRALPPSPENITRREDHIYPGVLEALQDNLNTPRALSLLQAMESDIPTLLATGQLLGLLKENPATWFKQIEADTSGNETIQQQISVRAAAKKVKNYAEADRIRKELAAQGIMLEDRPDGSTDWRRA